MNVFQLLIHSCVILNFSDGSLMSASCQWENGPIFKFEQTCKTDGIKQMGSKERSVDLFRCLKLTVN